MLIFLKRAPLHASKYFSFESYINAGDKNSHKTFLISHVKN